jgi:hypothetical protein
MAAFPSPEVADIRDDSRLRPEQIGKAMTSEQFNADIAGRIPPQVEAVEMELLNASSGIAWPFTNSAIAAALGDVDADAERERQAGQATEVAKLLALADLFRSAGQLSEAFREQAKLYRDDAQTKLDSLLRRVMYIVGKQAGAEAASNLPEAPRSRTVRLRPQF